MTKPFIAGEALSAARAWRSEAHTLMLTVNNSKNPVFEDSYSGFANSSDTGGVEISPDGRYGFCSITANPRILTYDTQTDTIIDPFAGALTVSPTAIRFNPAGDLIAIAYPSAPFVELWSYPGFVNQGAFSDLPISKINDLQWTPDGTKIVAVSDDAPFIHVWDPTTRASIAPTFASPPTADCDYLSCSNTIVMASGKDTGANKRAYDLTTGANLLTDTADGWVSAFSPDGSVLFMIASGFADEIRVYDTSTWSFTDASFAGDSIMGGLFNNPDNSRTMIAFDNDHVLFHFEGGTFLFNATTETIIYKYVNAPADVGRLALHPGSAIRKISGSVDDGAASPLERDIRVLDRATGKLVGEGRSDVTGAFEIILLTPNPVEVLALGEGSEATKRLSNITPVSL